MRYKSLYVFVVLLAYAVLLGSCVSKVPDCSDDRKVIFSAVIGNANKAELTEELAYPEDRPFAVWAYELPATTDWDSSSSFAHSVIEGEQTHYHNGHWCTDREHLWPEETQMLNFFAYSPAVARAYFSLERGVVFEDFSLDNDAEFMCSIPINNAQKPDIDATVNMVFRSPLCEIEIYAYSSATDGAEIFVNDVELVDIAAVADFHSLPKPTWDRLGEKKSICVFNGNYSLSEKTSLLKSELKIIPQDIRVRVRYSFKNHESDDLEYREATLTPGAFMRPVAGAVRSYVLKITQETVEIVNPTEGYED